MIKGTTHIDAFRVAGDKGDVNGAYAMRFHNQRLNVIASDGLGWDHVSVSCDRRSPTWEEMEYVKGLFFKPSETAYQLHVPPSDHINCHPYCLHLWRPQTAKIPRPPGMLVAPKQMAAAKSG